MTTRVLICPGAHWIKSERLSGMKLCSACRIPDFNHGLIDTQTRQPLDPRPE